MNTPSWRETESRVHQPALWLVLVVGAAFFLGGIVFLLVFGSIRSTERAPGWIVGPFLGLFVATGAGLMIWCGYRARFARTIRHATGILADVPTGPETLDGSILHARLSHELVESGSGWEYRPDERRDRSDRRFLTGFGLPFLLLISGLMAYALHAVGLESWVVSALIALLMTGIVIGSVLKIMMSLMRATQRSRCRFVIPAMEGDIAFESTDGLEACDLAAFLKGAFTERDKRRLVIPRRQVVAVQLCPWVLVMGSNRRQTRTWGVQGLLVLAGPGGPGYRRLPILLTSAFDDAARLMRRLSEALGVPFLFHADAAGWQAETARARTRPPLRGGGMVT